jgi:hypothetical protein
MYRRLVPSWHIPSDRKPSDPTHVTYAQSRNRTLNTKRHIKSSVHRLFSDDSCIFIPRVNFTNKAPPIIKTLTNFSLGSYWLLSIFSQPSIPSIIIFHLQSTMTTLRAITPTAISRPTSNIISSAHLHPFTNVPVHHLMCSVHPRLSRLPWLRITPSILLSCLRLRVTPDSSALDFICGHEQVATPPFCFRPIDDEILERVGHSNGHYVSVFNEFICIAKNILIFTSYLFCVISYIFIIATNTADRSLMALTAGAPLYRRLRVWILLCRRELDNLSLTFKSGDRLWQICYEWRQWIKLIGWLCNN